MVHPAAAPDEDLLAACDVRGTRGSGPGGQRRNKVETGVELVHRPTGTAVRAVDHRSRAENLRAALGRLRLTLAVTVRTAAPAAPSELWRSRCRGGRIAVNPAHRDVPLLLAEALDRLASVDWEGPAAAASLGCSRTQLVRLLALHPPALAAWNAVRAERGLRPLRV